MRAIMRVYVSSYGSEWRRAMREPGIFVSTILCVTRCCPVVRACGRACGCFFEIWVGRETGDARARDFVSTILFGFQRIRKQKVDFLTGDKNMSRVFCNDDLRHCTADA